MSQIWREISWSILTVAAGIVESLLLDTLFTESLRLQKIIMNFRGDGRVNSDLLELIAS